MRNYDPKTAILPLILLPISALAFLKAFYYLADSVYFPIAKNSMLSWPETKGLVVNTRVHTKLTHLKGASLSNGYTSKSYLPVVNYRYVVQGKEYKNHQVENTNLFYGSRENAETLLKNYSKGMETTVHYNPNNPEESYLVKNPTGIHANGIVASAGMLFMAFLLLSMGLPDHMLGDKTHAFWEYIISKFRKTEKDQSTIYENIPYQGRTHNLKSVEYAPTTYSWTDEYTRDTGDWLQKKIQENHKNTCFLVGDLFFRTEYLALENGLSSLKTVKRYWYDKKLDENDIYKITCSDQTYTAPGSFKLPQIKLLDESGQGGWLMLLALAAFLMTFPIQVVFFSHTLSAATNYIDFSWLDLIFNTTVFVGSILSAIWLYRCIINLSKECLDVVLHRHNGLIQFYEGKKGYTKIPFSELTPYQFRRGKYGNNNPGYESLLCVYHSKSQKWYFLLSLTVDQYDSNWWIDAEIAWALLCQYMDVNQPLPDIPDFEPFRHLDPTTASYDLKVKRPHGYWQNMSNHDYMDKAELDRETIDRFVLESKINELSIDKMKRDTPYRYKY